MPKVTYIEANGTKHEVEVAVGTSVMQGALDNLIEGILAECGGCCSCATCHCFVDDAWKATTGDAGETESDLLEMVEGCKPNSRLSCQITVDDSMSGLIVRLPESQG